MSSTVGRYSPYRPKENYLCTGNINLEVTIEMFYMHMQQFKNLSISKQKHFVAYSH